VVVDDGSEDYTTLRAMNFIGRMKIVVLLHPDRGFSAVGSKLMADPYNLGLAHLEGREWDHLLILGADTAIPPRYMENLLNYMTPEMGVISGRHPGITEKSTSGTGRLIKREVIKELGGRVPSNYAWESSVVLCARYMGLETGSFPVPIYNLRPPKTRKRGYINTGRSLKERGYFWPYAFHYAYCHVRKGRIWLAIQALIGYMLYTPEEPLAKWAQHNNQTQKESVKRKLRLMK